MSRAQSQPDKRCEMQTQVRRVGPTFSAMGQQVGCRKEHLAPALGRRQYLGTADNCHHRTGPPRQRR